MFNVNLNKENIKRYKKRYEDIFNINSGVKELKYDDFIYIDKKLYYKNKNNNYGFILVYAPWCEHCLKIALMWSELAIQFKYKFDIYALNSEDIKNKNDHIVAKLNVKKYPTLFIINNKSKVVAYKYNVNLNDIIFYISLKIKD